ncbi:MAG TPA: Ig-like domain repeat protein, partial [Anaerolineales bacterium]|nr:Ig-like domain repeat protein [Anaerolineales bacterium]
EVGLSVTGTSGHSGWYKSNIDVSATAIDATSGVATFEVAVDEGGYENYVPVAFEDGRHTLQFRVVDNAGNVFEPPMQKFNVDTIPPTIDLPSAWRLGKDVDYSVRDEGSGLASVRIVIEDENEKFSKVTWDRDASGKSYASHIDWNGEFKDKTVAPPGTYQVWVKAKDVAGNERFAMGKIIVSEPNMPLMALPTADPLATEAALLPPAELVEVEDIPVIAGEGTTIGSSSSGTTTQTFLLTTGSAGAAASTTTSGVLWGAAAAAAISAVTAYAVETTRKRKEAEEAQEAAVRAEVAEDKARWAEHGMTKAEKQEAKAQQSEAHDAKVQERKDRDEWANLSAEDKAQLKWEQERDAAYAQEVWQKWLEDQNAKKTLGDIADGGLDGNIWTSDEGALLQDAVDKELFAHATLLGSVGGTNGGLDGNLWTSDEGAPLQDAVNKWVLDSHIVGTAPQVASVETKPPSLVDKFTDWLNGTIVDPLKDKAAPVMDTINDGIDWIDQTVYQPYIAPTLENVSTFVQDEIVDPVVKSSWFKPVVTVATIGSMIVTGAAANWQATKDFIAQSPIFTAANQNAAIQLRSFIEQYPEWVNHPEDQSLLEYFAADPYRAITSSSELFKSLTLGAAGYADAVWGQSQTVQMLTQFYENVGEAVCSSITDQAWSNRCYGAAYLTSSLLETPFDTSAGVINSWVVDPLAGLGKLWVFSQEHSLNQTVFDVITAAQEGGWEAVEEYGRNLAGDAWNQLVMDPQVQGAVFLLLLIGIACIPVVGAPIAGGIATGMTINNLIDLDAILSKLPDKESIIDFVSSHQVRTTIASSLLVFLFITLGAQKAAQFDALKNSLSPSTQMNFQDLPLSEQARIAEFATKMKPSPGALEFYINELARPGSPLAGLPLDQALHISSLAEQTGKGAFLIDYIARHGYTDALKIASPEAIKGMTNDQFLLQAQDILSNDAGYNVMPENVFTSYPGSTIGKTVTFITNEAAIKNIIGDFHGTKTIYITFDQAVALENALGLESGAPGEGFILVANSAMRACSLKGRSWKFIWVEGDKLFFRAS